MLVAIAGMSGISLEQRRKASGVQAARCSVVAISALMALLLASEAVMATTNPTVRSALVNIMPSPDSCRPSWFDAIHGNGDCLAETASSVSSITVAGTWKIQ